MLLYCIINNNNNNNNKKETLFNVSCIGVNFIFRIVKNKHCSCFDRRLSKQLDFGPDLRPNIFNISCIMYISYTSYSDYEYVSIK